MRLCVIGCGNVGRLVAKNRGVLGVSLKFFDRHPERCFEVCKDDCEVSTSFDEFLEGCDLVVEAASPEAVRQYAPQVLRKADMVVLSVGALMDKELYGRLLRIAENYGTSIVVPSGAVAGIDAIKALKNAGIEEVQVITTKNPKALGVNVEEKTVLFEGPASEAVKRFPTNVNVVATVSLAAGKEATVKVVADPSVDKNVHEIRVKSKAGELYVKVTNVPSPDNPKTSLLAALSLIETLKELVKKQRIRIGT
ncbi:aspartate dehydrogenase [Ignicoccus hospitalis]|uniref:L-aspartate dehydrogenase n=1 Tax=Ignicoccus hospitalis (strain KIN4/I / DSM 18386 / JCM 14125) TaxID=453591 RepID=A8AC73_IGNH4|nr:aspartate dehydrogenase [Ignicoccus hospitalis]ABU82525.1 Aspartate dehydrogenase [Ignicoccus hospitalis KIN4/I]HIH90689.1 aspartate dehydrogenase [Desulfurococcaceae archaeon]